MKIPSVDMRAFNFKKAVPPHGQERNKSSPYSRLGYGELMFMMMEKSGPFLAEILSILVLKVKANVYNSSSFERSNTLKIMTILFFRVSKGCVMTVAMSSKRTIIKSFERKTRREL